MIPKTVISICKCGYAFLLVLILNSMLFGGEDDIKNNRSDIYILNSAPLLNKEIMEILPWGVIIENSQTISYKVIEKITTNKKQISEEISRHVENVICEISGSGITLIFSNSVVKFKPVISDGKILRKFGFYLAALTNRAETFETGFYLYPKFLPQHFYIRLNASANLFSKYKNYQISGVFIGGGYDFDFDDLNLLTGISYGLKSIQYPDSWHLTDFDDGITKVDIITLEFISKYKIAGKFSFIAGLRYSFDDVKVEKKADYFTGCAGFCVTF